MSQQEVQVTDNTEQLDAMAAMSDEDFLNSLADAESKQLEESKEPDEKVTDTQSWYDIPTCKEAGVTTDYTMLRGIFMAPGVTQEQVDYYVNVFKKVRETPEWKKFMADGAFNQTFMTGKEFNNWLTLNEALHKQLMAEAGFLAK